MTKTNFLKSRPDWADDEELDDTANELPPQQITTNKDGTQTIITYRFNDEGKKVKTTRRIRKTVVTEVVNPRVAERKSWSKFGLSAKDKAGPAVDTTTVGENIIFKPSSNWRKDAKEEKTEAGSMKDKLKDKKVKCRICNGEHFTARCPFKDTMAPVGEDGSADVAGGAADVADGPGGLGAGKSSYVPPHMRNGGASSGAAGDRMGGGKYERDDLATLRVTNVSSSLRYCSRRQQLLTKFCRFQRWQKSKNCEICSSDSAESPEFSWPRTERQEWQRALLSSVTTSERMLRERARKWMALVSSI
jgi:translation initiation factor 3 subunit G